MPETTKEQLITAASTLLDSGGQEAVTLRAVAERVGVSHNAPYRHFRDRSALLAAVAERDFIYLRGAIDRHGEGSDAEVALRNASAQMIDYALKHQARYRLLFSDPDLSPGPGIKDAAKAAFQAFSRVVSRCQGEGVLPEIDTVRLTVLVYSTLHGAIDLELGGRSTESGLGSIEATADLLFHLLRRVELGE
jgi:AcrR family transcriptional regulator